MSFYKKERKTKKKLISKNKSTKKVASSNNSLLLSKIKDVKITLDLNQDLLYENLILRDGETDIIKSLVNKSKTLWKKYELLINNNNNINIKTEILKLQLPLIPSKINDKISNLSKINNIKQKELFLKDNTIKK